MSLAPPYSEDSQYPRIFSKSCLQFRDFLEDEMGRNILHCSSFWVSFQKPRAVHINYALDFILFVFVIFAGEKMLIFYCFLCLFYWRSCYFVVIFSYITDQVDTATVQ